MSLIDRKAVFTLPVFNKVGQLDETKSSEIVGTILDKVLVSYPNPNPNNESGVPLQYDIYIVETEDGDVMPLNPSYITKLLKK